MSNRFFADVSNNNASAMNFHNYTKLGGHLLLGHKATEGTNFLDRDHAERSEQAHVNGSWVLHYHFGHVGESAIQQANYFWVNIKGHFARRDFACIDTERGAANDKFSPHQDALWTNQFCAEFHRISGHSVIKYSNEALLKELAVSGLDHKDGRCWIAAYGPNKPIVGGFKTWAWQYTDGSIGPEPHHFAGIGNIDGSKLNVGTYIRLRMAGKP